MEFEEWLRTVCFQKPTPEAYDLAKCAYNFIIDEAVKIAENSVDGLTASEAIKELKD